MRLIHNVIVKICTDALSQFSGSKCVSLCFVYFHFFLSLFHSKFYFFSSKNMEIVNFFSYICYQSRNVISVKSDERYFLFHTVETT